MDIKEAVEIMKEFNIKEYRGRALQVLIDYAEDVQDIHKKVMNEKCASDEIHCTCVPVLRREIKELKGALDTAHKIFGSESDKLGAMIKGLEERILELYHHELENHTLKKKIK